MGYSEGRRLISKIHQAVDDLNTLIMKAHHQGFRIELMVDVKKLNFPACAVGVLREIPPIPKKKNGKK